MCSVISTLSDFKPCRTRQWQLRQFNSSQKSQDPKYSIPNLKKSKLQWQVSHRWWQSASTVTKGVVNEPATENKRVTAYWQVWFELTKGITALGHEVGLPSATSSFSGSHVHILRHFLPHTVNDTKWTRLCCWQCTNRWCLLRTVSDPLLSFWVSTSSSLHQL